MFAAIFIPDFALQVALRDQPELREKAVALLVGEGGAAKTVVCGATTAALRAGIQLGMSPTQAEARCPGIVLQERTIKKEQAARAAILELAWAVSPYLEVTREGLYTLDLRRLKPEKEKKDETPLALPTTRTSSLQRLGCQLHEQLAAFGFSAQIGLAANPDTAALAAHIATPVARLDGDDVSLQTLPVSALQSDEEMTRVFRLWGIRTVRDFTALSRDEVHRRLGESAVRLWDVAMGKCERLLRLSVPGEEFAERFEFEFEVDTSEPLLFILRRFVDALGWRLAADYRGKTLYLTLEFSTGSDYRRTFSLPSPTGNPDVLFRILSTHLEDFTTDFPIISVELKIDPVKATKDQFELFSGTLRDPNQFAETVARLGAMLGSDSVGVPLVQNTFRPDAFAMMAVDCSSRLSAISNATSSGEGLALWRYRPAPPAAILLFEDKPVFLHTDNLAGRIVDRRGPWLSSGEWWQMTWHREEWDIELQEGGLYRIYREEEKWYLEGVYD